MPPRMFPVEALEPDFEVPLASTPAPSLRDRFGVARGVELLASLERVERLRGVDRLAARGGDEAIDALVQALERGHPARVDPFTRLSAVRALAPHVHREGVRQALAEILGDVSARAPEATLERVARETAALALARSDAEAALIPLYAAVISGGDTGEIARRALLAFPPSEPLRPLGKNLDEISPRILSLVGDLGDPRLLGFLRKRLSGKDEARKRAAALALAKLGDDHAREPAEAWAKSKEVANQLLAVEIGLWLDMQSAPVLLARLLGQAKTRTAALALVERAPSAALVPTLEAIIAAKVTDAERDRAAAILARTGGDAAASVLLGLLARPDLATRAAFGLARNTSATAQVGLSRALAGAPAGPSRRLVVRAGVVRALATGQRVDGLVAALEGALASADQIDRYLGAFGLSALGEGDLSELIGHASPEVAAGAAAGAMARGPVALAELAPLLHHDDPALRAAGAPALLVSSGGVSPVVLAAMAEAGGPVAPLAAYRLAALDPASLRPRIERLLGASDALIRAHVALGLGRSPESNALASLVDRYRFEDKAEVRRAIVRALSLRPERRRRATLELARDLDPDGEVRALAASALDGRALPPSLPPAGGRAAWLTLRPSAPAEHDEVRLRPVALVRSDGLALPAVSAPDGVVLVVGLEDWGEVGLRVGITAPPPRPVAPRPAIVRPRGDDDDLPDERPDDIDPDDPDDLDAAPLAPDDDSLNPSADGP